MKSGMLQVAASLGILFPVLMPAQNPVLDPTSTSLEDLLNMKVTSVSKKEQPLSRTAAAAFVIDQEDIRRSGYFLTTRVRRSAFAKITWQF